MLDYATLRYAMQSYATPRYATLCKAMLRYAILCYATLRHAMLALRVPAFGRKKTPNWGRAGFIDLFFGGATPFPELSENSFWGTRNLSIGITVFEE